MRQISQNTMKSDTETNHPFAGCLRNRDVPSADTHAAVNLFDKTKDKFFLLNRNFLRQSGTRLAYTVKSMDIDGLSMQGAMASIKI